MCYKKPAPRCSSHALKALRTAKANLEQATVNLEVAEKELQDAGGSPRLITTLRAKSARNALTRAEKSLEAAQENYTVKAEEKKVAYKAFKEAKYDYSLTPKGIADVRKQGDNELADKLKAKRKALVEEAKVVNGTEQEQVATTATSNLVDYQRPFHKAPVADEDCAPAYDLESLIGDDYLKNPHHYTGRKADKELFSQLKRIRGNPDAMVKIYRALPVGYNHINGGDWVALSKDYANTHLNAIVGGSSTDAGKYHVIESEVKASTLWCEGNDIAEFGYDGEQIVTK